LPILSISLPPLIQIEAVEKFLFLLIKKYFFNDNFYKKIIKKKKDKRLIEEFKKIKKYQKK